MEEITYIGETYNKFLFAVLFASYWFISSTLDTYQSSLLAPIFFSKLLKDYIQGQQRKITICLQPSNIFFLFIEIYWSINEAFKKYFWSVLNVIFMKSSIIIISPKSFQLNWGNGTSKNHVSYKKQKFLKRLRKIHFSGKNLNSIS